MSASGRMLGPYRLLQRLDFGGMAEVYAARVELDPSVPNIAELARLEFLAPHPPVGTTIALKRLLPLSAGDDELQAMFAQEVRVAARQSHPGLCAVYAWGWDQDTPFLAMELIEGRSWKSLVALAEERGRPIPVAVAVALAIQVCEALAALHGEGEASHNGEALGVVHRDVSPHNIMVDWQGQARLIDFGIATAQGQARSTQAGIVKGKLGYVAPEQLGSGRLDGRTDLFALGVILWEALALRRLFVGKTVGETLERMRSVSVPKLAELGRQVPAAVEGVVARLLALQPDQRPASALAARDALCGAAQLSASEAKTTVRQWLDAAIPQSERTSLGVEEPDRFASSAEGQGEVTTDRHHTSEATRMFDIEAWRAAAASASSTGISSAVVAGDKTKQSRTPAPTVVSDALYALGLGAACWIFHTWASWIP